MWFTLALLGYLLLALVFILDKVILTKAVVKPVVYAFYSTIFMFGALLAWPFGVGLLWGSDWLWAVVSGLAFGFGLWAMFVAVKGGEASHINPFVGAAVTIFTFGLSYFFLFEDLTNGQQGGLVILVFASFLLSFEKSRKHRGWHRGFLWAILAGFLFAVSHVTAKYIYEIYPFLTGFVWTRAATGLVGLILLVSPAVRNSFKKSNDKSKTYAKQYTIFLITLDKILGIAGMILVQSAIAIGSVTLVNSLSGAQYAFMFALIYLLTKLAPRVFKEYFTKRELAVEWMALGLVAVGSVFLVR